MTAREGFPLNRLLLFNNKWNKYLPLVKQISLSVIVRWERKSQRKWKSIHSSRIDWFIDLFIRLNLFIYVFICVFVYIFDERTILT